MKDVYDNGEKMLGRVKDIKLRNDTMLKKQMIDEDTWSEWAKELVYYDDNDIICIDYTFGMGILIEKWEENDKLEEIE